MAETDSYIWRSLFPESLRHRPCNRSKQAACRYRGQIYMYGGRDGNRTLRDFWRYNVLTNIWTRMECGGDTPPPLQEHTMIAWRGCLFIFGGELGYGSCGETPLWIYSIARQTWEKPVIESEVMTPTGRRGHTAVAWRGGMHVYGGYVDLKGSSNELWTLDFETRWWHLSADAQQESSPSPRHCHSAVVHESNMWVYGGLNNLQPLRDLWKWSFESRQWARVKGRQSPGFLHGHSAVLVADSLLMFGGEDSEGEYRNELWKFHFGSTSWYSTTPNQRIAPTSCTRHVILSIPSNHIPDGSYLCPLTGDLRPQSAPTQVHHDQSYEGGGAETPLRNLTDLFVLRPHSSPPVVSNENRRVHHFVNRVHPSPDDGSDLHVTAKEDGKLVAVAANDDARTYIQGDGETENGKWAVAKISDDARGDCQRGEERRKSRYWAVTSSVAAIDVDQVEETETCKLIINEESPVHCHHRDRRWVERGESVIDKSSSPLQQRDEECILEDVLSEPSSPVPSTAFQQDFAEDCVGLDSVCNILAEADKIISQIPKNDTSGFNRISNERLNNNRYDFHNDSVFSSLSNGDAYETIGDLGHSGLCSNHRDVSQEFSVGVLELPSIQEPKEQNIMSVDTPPRREIIHVRPLEAAFAENNNIKLTDVSTDRHELIQSNVKPVATFVNLGFMSSHEALHQHPHTSHGMDFKIQQSGPPSQITNGSIDQSHEACVPGSQSDVTLYSQRLVVQAGHNTTNQSQPATLIVSGTIDQSDTSRQPAHYSSAILHQWKHQTAQVELTSHQPAIHIKPTNHRVCQITVEEMSGPNHQSSDSINQMQHGQRSQHGVCRKIYSRPRLHVRSQTLNNLPDGNQRVPERPQTLGVAGLPLGQHEEQQLSNDYEEDDEDVWTWPIFLYLMGGKETGSCSLHQNSSPMSVWKCCILQGKPSDSEIQYILSQY